MWDEYEYAFPRHIIKSAIESYPNLFDQVYDLNEAGQSILHFIRPLKEILMQQVFNQKDVSIRIETFIRTTGKERDEMVHELSSILPKEHLNSTVGDSFRFGRKDINTMYYHYCKGNFKKVVKTFNNKSTWKIASSSS